MVVYLIGDYGSERVLGLRHLKQELIFRTNEKRDWLKDTFQKASISYDGACDLLLIMQKMGSFMCEVKWNPTNNPKWHIVDRIDELDECKMTEGAKGDVKIAEKILYREILKRYALSNHNPKVVATLPDIREDVKKGLEKIIGRENVFTLSTNHHYIY